MFAQIRLECGKTQKTKPNAASKVSREENVTGLQQPTHRAEAARQR